MSMHINKKLQIIAINFILAIIAVSCSAVKEKEKTYQVKDKSVLIYMIGNNSLSSHAQENLTSLLGGYIPSDDGYLLVYIHSTVSDPVLLNINSNSGKINVDTLYKFPSRNSATPESLSQTIKVATTLCPAKEYGLILWSHGTGWLPTGYYANGTFPSSSASPALKYAKRVVAADTPAEMTFGSENSIEIEIAKLKNGLPHKFSYIIFDACLMGGIETAYELKDSTDYIVFSPAEVLADGFPYNKIMKHLFSSSTTEENIINVAKEYYNHYNEMTGQYKSATVSVIKTSALSNLASATKEVFDSKRADIQSMNMSSIQGYFRTSSRHWFYDIQDFIDQLATTEMAKKFDNALNAVVLYKASTEYMIDLPIVKYSGISTYIPNPVNTDLDNFYKNLAWNAAVGMIE